MATIYENSKNSGIIVNRLCYPDSHTPASSSLEKKFYIDEKIIEAMFKLLNRKK